ncbi:MAG: 16S rRNA (guanine(966)-N(2))-methyltransferase RsmD [Xanthomonadales bacterium]|nr:16S rRNA (guanine(966)-N(2))-methyltransferase RsmD [Xanthomonadales bacterium]NIX13719.1 16S rRNA (guanine(966)-N(2))-methyltransferase RsmD [Xanthomonadales bacterium]
MAGKSKKHSIRIIAGEWRGRRLPVLNVPGLRPSGDRCRETLFNWLQPYVEGAECADLFAGTGALGLEAASRGARSVVLVEKNSAVVGALDRSINMLRALQVRVHRGDALEWLRRTEPDSLDIVFVDPPFDEGLILKSALLVDRLHSVREGGFVYIEEPATRKAIIPGPGWELWKEKKIGEVRMQLFRRVPID